jgi:16S rRNA (guanine527-N7)-methyltransferase
MNLLRQGCDQLGLTLTDHQIDQFERYFHTLVAWNEKMNLTAITGYADVQVKHFLDSLVALPLIAEELGDVSIPARNLHLVDVGAGAGFPGVPLKIAAPHLRLTLMDGTGKKVQFLRMLVETLELSHADVVQGRAEELARNTAYRGQFDLVVARAVAPLNTLAEYLLPLARRNGLVVAYKGGSAAQEFIDARHAIETLGGEPVRFAPVKVPFLDEQRFILLIKKVRQTPSAYPRGQGLARKKPL